MKNKLNKIPFPFRVDQDLLEDVKLIADKNNTNISVEIREAMKDRVNYYKHQRLQSKIDVLTLMLCELIKSSREYGLTKTDIYLLPDKYVDKIFMLFKSDRKKEKIEIIKSFIDYYNSKLLKSDQLCYDELDIYIDDLEKNVNKLM